MSSGTAAYVLDLPETTQVKDFAAGMATRAAQAGWKDVVSVADIEDFARLGASVPISNLDRGSSSPSDKPGASSSSSSSSSEQSAMRDAGGHTEFHPSDVMPDTSSPTGMAAEERVGRLGSGSVGWIATLGPGSVRMGPYEGGMSVESVSNFASVVASSAVFKGKWMYEVVLETGGVLQIGWATMGCKFSTEEGVGDSPDSYAYDGSRVQKWNCDYAEYGEPWGAGDVIGVAIDLDNGTVSYARNGVFLGIAFQDVAFDAPGMAYFPAISIARNERVWINTGGQPLRYPLPGGYMALDPSPRPLIQGQTAYLIASLKRFLPVSIGPDPELPSHLQVIVLARIFQPLFVLLTQNPYLITRFWVPFLVYISTRSTSSSSSLLPVFLDKLARVLTPYEIQTLAVGTMSVLSIWIRSTPFSPAHPTGPLLYLRAAAALVNNDAFRTGWVASRAFAKQLEDVLAVNTPSAVDVAVLIPHVWWEGAETHLSAVTFDRTERYDADRYHAALLDVSVALASVEAVHSEIMGLLLAAHPHAVHAWLDEIVQRNSAVTRNVVPPGLSTRSTLVSLFFALAKIALPSAAAAEACGAALDLSGFGQTSPWAALDSLDRVGGPPSHVFKEHGLVASGESEGIEDGYVLHALVCLAHFGLAPSVKKAQVKAQKLRAELSALHSKITVRNASVFGSAHDPDVFANVEAAIRGHAWASLRMFSETKQSLIFSVHLFATAVLESASPHQAAIAERPRRAVAEEGEEGFPLPSPEFSSVPELYVSVMIDTLQMLRRAMSPFPLAEQSERVGVSLSWALAHVSDFRITNPDTRSTLLQSLCLLLQYEDHVELMEGIPFLESHFVPRILSAYDDRFWVTVTVTTMLLRMFKGVGAGTVPVAPRGTRAIPSFLLPDDAANTGSELFQSSFVETCRNDESLRSLFFNTVFNSLNWTLTELSVALERYTQIPGHSAEAVNASRKLNVMFVLAIKLLRVLEITTLVLPDLYLEVDGCDVHFTRMLEVVTVVLNQYTTGPDAHLFTEALEASAARREQREAEEDLVNQTELLQPLAGILMALDDASEEEDYIAKALLTIPSFSEETTEFVLMKLALPPSSSSSESPGMEAVLESDSRRFSAFVHKIREGLVSRDELLAASSISRSPSADICSICYANIIDATFDPCSHRACHSCMTRQLLNTPRCFFCNSAVDQIVRDPQAES